MGDLAHSVLILESSMQETQLWSGVSRILEERLKARIISQKIDSHFIGRKDLYDKGVLSLEPSQSHFVKEKYSSIFTALFSRVDIYGEFSPELSEVFACRYVNYWIKFLKEYDVGIVISPVPPHRFFDFALLVACELLDVKYVSFQTTPFDKCIFVIDRFIGRGDFIVDLDLKAPDFQDSLESDIKRRCLNYEYAIPKYELQNIAINHGNFRNLIQKVRKIFNLDYKFWSAYKLSTNILYGGHVTFLQYALYNLKKARDLRNLRQSYSRCACTVNLSKKYIYFPLHYQPEETTCPTGGVFSNQLLVIDQLLYSTPDDVLIYVKEHRSQFNGAFDGNLGREPSHYSFLSKNSRVKLVPMDVDQFALIDNSQMVASVSGTVGYEAYCRGIKAMMFGRTWLNGLTNVQVFTDSMALRSFYEAPPVVMSLAQKVDELSAILRKSVYAIHDENYESLYGPPSSDDERILAEALIKYIEDKNVFSNL